MKTDPRTLERRIIEKDRRYLWGAKDGAPVWVPSPYDAWWDQENSGANVLMVAKETGGTVRTFNPLTGELKDMTIEKTAAVLHELSSTGRHRKTEEQHNLSCRHIRAEGLHRHQCRVRTISGIRNQQRSQGPALSAIWSHGPPAGIQGNA